MKARRFSHAPQREMDDVLRCAEALQHWPLDRIEKAMMTKEAEILARLPGWQSVLEMIRLAQPHGMDAIVSMALRDHEKSEVDFDYVPVSRATTLQLREFVTLAKLRCLLIQRACPKARRTLFRREAPVPAVQREMRMPGITISTRP